MVLKVYSETIKFPRTPAAASGPGVRGRAAPIKPIRLSPGIFARGLIAKRVVRTRSIVFNTPAFHE